MQPCCKDKSEDATCKIVLRATIAHEERNCSRSLAALLVVRRRKRSMRREWLREMNLSLDSSFH